MSFNTLNENSHPSLMLGHPVAMGDVNVRCAHGHGLNLLKTAHRDAAIGAAYASVSFGLLTNICQLVPFLLFVRGVKTKNSLLMQTLIHKTACRHRPQRRQRAMLIFVLPALQLAMQTADQIELTLQKLLLISIRHPAGGLVVRRRLAAMYCACVVYAYQYKIRAGKCGITYSVCISAVAKCCCCCCASN